MKRALADLKFQFNSLGYSPDPSGSPMTFPLPTDPSNPFPITPGDNSNPGDDDAFNGPHKVLAAVPHKTGGNNGDLKPGSGNYALLGMAQPGELALDSISVLQQQCGMSFV
jgi:hypothetical protein